MRKVLIIFPIPHQKELVENIKKYVSSPNLSFDYLDIKTWKLYSNEVVLNDTLYSKFLCMKFDNRFLHRILCRLQYYAHKLLDKILLKQVFMRYDIIDFHFYGNLYDNLLPLAKQMGKKIKINIWGSDLLRTNVEQRRKQLKGYELADTIVVATQSMKNIFEKYFPQFISKVRVQHFGNHRLSEFDKMNGNMISYSILNNYKAGKLVVTCGYNGSPGQQHLMIISMLNNLPLEVKRNIHIVFPMTYGMTSNYLAYIIDSIASQEYSYDILTNRLSEESLFNLRQISDIVINIQETDAMAGSIQEHIYCNNIMLLGDWLPYSIFKDAGIYFVPTSLPNLGENFMKIYNNIDKYRVLSNSNKSKIRDLCAWDKVAIKWFDIYQSIMN